MSRGKGKGGHEEEEVTTRRKKIWVTNDGDKRGRENGGEGERGREGKEKQKGENF